MSNEFGYACSDCQVRCCAGEINQGDKELAWIYRNVWPRIAEIMEAARNDPDGKFLVEFRVNGPSWVELHQDVWDFLWSHREHRIVVASEYGIDHSTSIPVERPEGLPCIDPCRNGHDFLAIEATLKFDGVNGHELREALQGFKPQLFCRRCGKKT